MLDSFDYKDKVGAGVSLKRSAFDDLTRDQHGRRVISNIVEVVVRDKFGNEKSRSVTHNLRTNLGADFWDSQLFALSQTLTGTNTITSIAAASGTNGPNGTKTTVYTGTFTNGGNNAYAGFLITLTGGTTAANNGTYLCVGSSTTTIELANPNGATQGAPTFPTVWTTTWTGQGGYVFNWIGLTENSSAANAGDTTLTSEETTNGLGRAQASDAHSASATSSVLTHTWTYTGSSSKVIAKVGLFNQSTNGVMGLESLLASTATVNTSGDTITVTWTINY
jgi:hypothetical protein